MPTKVQGPAFPPGNTSTPRSGTTIAAKTQNCLFPRPQKAQCLKHPKPRFFKKHESCQRLNKSAINQGGPSIIFFLSFPDFFFFFFAFCDRALHLVFYCFEVPLTAKLRGPMIFGSTLKVHTHTCSFITRVDGARAEKRRTRLD